MISKEDGEKQEYITVGRFTTFVVQVSVGLRE